MSRYLKRFMMMGRFLPSSQISGSMYYTVLSIKCMMWEVFRSPTLYRYWEIIIDFKWHKHGLLSCFRPLTEWGLYRFFWKSQRRDQSNDSKFNPPLFSLIITLTYYRYVKRKNLLAIPIVFFLVKVLTNKLCETMSTEKLARIILKTTFVWFIL